MRRSDRESGGGDLAGRHGRPCAGSGRAASGASAPTDRRAAAAAAPVSVSTTAWLIAAVVVLAGVIVISLRAPSLWLDNQVNSAVLRLFARARTPWLTDLANGIYTAGSAAPGWASFSGPVARCRG